MTGLAGPLPAAIAHPAGARSSGSSLAARRPAIAAIVAARLRTTPALTRAGAAAIVVTAAALAAAVAVAFASVASSLSSIGETDAPEVSAAAGLYFSLNDMDAQVANVLLPGAALEGARPGYLASYARDREVAYGDLQQAAVTAAGNPAAQRQLRSILVETGQYEALAADALLAHQQGTGTGPALAVGGTGVGYYQQATDLMRTRILPQVSSLASVSTARLNGAYDSGRSAARAGEITALVAGLLLVAVLAGFQAFLARRFRRRVNPALAATTLLALTATVLAVAGLAAEAGHLKVAKQDAFNSIVALTQARAVSYDANADESRYLADPGRAAMYQQSFLAASQQLAGVGPVGISRYDAALAADITAYQARNADVRFGGYLGAEFRNITFPGERAAAVATLLAYQRYERDDRVLRSLAGGSPRAAAEFDTGTQPGQSNWAFYQYDQALTALIGINQRAFTTAIAAGQGEADGWNGLIPAGGAALIAALVIIGVRPRLAEYRR